MQTGGHLADVVLSEVIYGIRFSVQKTLASIYAEQHNETHEYEMNKRQYMQRVQMPSGWRTLMYRDAQCMLQKLLATYPIAVDDRALVDKALEVGVCTGYDWVDCWLIAQHCLYGTEVVSVDSDVLTGLILFPFLPEEEVVTDEQGDQGGEGGGGATSPSDPLSKMNLD